MFTAADLLGWVVAVFLGLVGLFVLWNIFTNRIDLRYLIADEHGDASISRFQFLIFTVVIAGGVAYYVLNHNGDFPPLTTNALLLLGISGGSYAIGKSLSNQADAQKLKAERQANG